MKVTADFKKGTFTLTGDQIVQLMQDCYKDGMDEGFDAGKAEGIKLTKQEMNKNVSSPTITKVEDKPEPVTIPDNNKELLEHFFKPNTETEMVAKKAFEDGYRLGHQKGYKQGENGEKPVFDPKLHVDNSVYGYTTLEAMGNLASGKHEAIAISRKPSPFVQKEKEFFVKITPVNPEMN